MKLLQLNSSIRGADSLSTKYASLISEKIVKENKANLVVRDLEKDPIPVFDTKALNAVFGIKENKDILCQFDYLINEILEQDVLVIGAPMYNFAISTQLKNYFDAIARAGKTFKYNEDGQSVGLTKIKKAFIVLSRGGKYKEHGLNFQDEYLTKFLHFIGVKDIEFFYIEGVNMGEEVANQEMSIIEKKITGYDFKV